MALSTTEQAVLGCLDRLAYISRACAYIGSSGTDLWHRVDATNDQVFEDRVKGATSTLADLAVRNMQLGNLTYLNPTTGLQENALYDWVALLRTYATTDLAYASVDAWFTARKWRVDAATRDILEACLGRGTISVANVAAPGDAGAAAPGLLLGTFTRGSAYAAGSSISTTLYDESPIICRVTGQNAADWTLSITFKLKDATTKTIAQVVTGTGTTGAVGDVYVLGQQAISGGAASGQKVVPVAATAQFKAGQKVLLTEWSGVAPNEVYTSQEIATIDTIQTDTSLTMLTNLVHTYTTSGFVNPCGVAITACSSTGGGAGDICEFYPAADRRLKA